MQNQIKSEIGIFVLAIVAGLALGFASGFILLGIFLAIGLYLSWLLIQISRIERWLADPQRDQAPETLGLLEHVVARIQKALRIKDLEMSALRDELDQQTKLIAEVRDGVLITNSSGRIVWSNHQAQKLLKIIPDRDHGLQLTHVIRSPSFHTYLSNEQFFEPLRLNLGINRPRWMEISVTQYEKGERLLIVRDVTRLQQLEQMRRDFIANLSHELKTPLTVLRGYLETLQVHENSSPSVTRIHAEMEKQSERMSSLLKDLLLLAQLEDPDNETSTTIVDVPGMLHRLIEDARRLDIEKTHTIEPHIDEALKLSGVETELFSAFSNLIINSIRHTPNGTHIDVRWYANEEGAHFVVKDDGPGIDSRHIRRLTERFYRVEGSRNSSTGGTGLGLAIVKHVMLRQGADLEIDSTLGAGSTFACHFPAKQIVYPQQNRSSQAG